MKVRRSQWLYTGYIHCLALFLPTQMESGLSKDFPSFPQAQICAFLYVLAFTTVNQKPGSAQKYLQSAFHRNIIFLLRLATVLYLVMLFLSHSKNLHHFFCFRMNSAFSCKLRVPTEATVVAH